MGLDYLKCLEFLLTKYVSDSSHYLTALFNYNIYKSDIIMSTLFYRENIQNDYFALFSKVFSNSDLTDKYLRFNLRVVPVRQKLI